MRRTAAISLTALVAVLLGASAVQAELGLKAIEARVGFTDLEGAAGSTFIVSGGVDMGKLTPDIGLEFGVDFWTKSWGEGFFDASTTNIGFLANVRYNFRMEGTIHPFAFAGASLHYFSSSASCDGCGWLGENVDNSDSEIDFGANFGAGAEFGSGGSMVPLVRGGYNINGGMNYIFIQGGLKFFMGK